MDLLEFAVALAQDSSLGALFSGFSVQGLGFRGCRGVEVYVGLGVSGRGKLTETLGQQGVVALSPLSPKP